MTIESTKHAPEYYFGPRWPYCCLRCSTPITDPNRCFCDYHYNQLEDLCLVAVDARKVPDGQLQVLKFIARTMKETGLAPSMEEIGHNLGFSRQAAHYHVVSLTDRKLLVRSSGRARAMVLTAAGRSAIARSEREPVPVPSENSTPP